MNNDEQPLYEYESNYERIILFPNRITLYTPGILNVKNETIIPIKSLSNIKLTGVSKNIEICTLDGKSEKLNFLTGENSENFRDALINLL